MTEKKGIDISRWNGNVNLEAAKNAGVEFVIIKAGGSDAGIYTDPWFERNYKKAKEAGLHVGAYYFVGKNFLTKEDGLADAKRFEELLKGKQWDYPVFLDIESTGIKDKKNATTASIAFCEYLEEKGYYVGIYASDIYGFKERLEIERLGKFDKWVRRYGSKPKYVKDYGIHQFTSKGQIQGFHDPKAISVVDINTSFKDYPNIIKKAGLNGYKKVEKKTPKKTKEEKEYIVFKFVKEKELDGYKGFKKAELK